MIKHGFRFSPPEITFGPELRWVLLRGFGPWEAETSYPVDPKAARALATALDLSPRIGARIGPERLRAEVGPECAREFLIASAVAEAQGRRLLRLAHEVAAVAANASVPLVLLKFVAMQLSGVLVAGSRSAVDLDVMVAPSDVGRFSDALRSIGFAMSGVPHSDQHVAPFLDASGRIVEVHRYVQGVSLGREGSFASADELAAGGFLVPTAQLPGDCSIPTNEVTAAHIIAHGVAHHGRKPQEYPLFRMVADLIDLGFAFEEGEVLLGRIMPWLERDVSSEETRAVRDLCVRLALGEEEFFTEAGMGRPEALLLRHLVAGSTDQAYAQSLQVAAFLGRVSHLPRPVALARAAWHALFLNRAQVEKIYGPQRSHLGYVRRQILRPFDLLVQAARAIGERAWMRSRPKA